MVQFTQESIYNRFPWAKPVDLVLDNSNEGFFCDTLPWSFNQKQLKTIYTMLAEVEQWFVIKNKPIEIIIVEFKEIQGHVVVEKICGYPEIDAIFEKYVSV